MLIIVLLGPARSPGISGLRVISLARKSNFNSHLSHSSDSNLNTINSLFNRMNKEKCEGHRLTLNGVEKLSSKCGVFLQYRARSKVDSRTLSLSVMNKISVVAGEEHKTWLAQ